MAGAKPIFRSSRRSWTAAAANGSATAVPTFEFPMAGATMLETHAGRATCEEMKLADLAARFGTPLYVYSRRRLKANTARVARAFAPLRAHLRYSVKANSNGAILRLLREWGAGFDVVSAGELYRSLQAGASPGAVVFAGVGKSDAELRYAVETGVGWINVDEAGRLLADAARYPHLDLAGVHVHVGSQLASPDATVAAVRKALELVDRYRLRMLDIGGGFPVNDQAGADAGPAPAPSDFAEALAPLLRDRDLELMIEPGRSIVADAGLLLTCVLYVKQRAGRQIVVVDAGMTDLIRPALYDAYHPIVPLQAHSATGVLSDVVGPVCESADAFAHDRPLPPMQRGDLLAITHAGAYGMSMASNYNSRLRPAEVLVDGASAWLIRRRETMEDLLAMEVSEQ